MLRDLSGGLPLLLRRNHDRHTVVVRSAHEANLSAGHSKVPYVDISRDIGTSEVAYMQATVRVRETCGDENLTGSCTLLSSIHGEIPNNPVRGAYKREKPT
jgi:hypothetical protein